MPDPSLVCLGLGLALELLALCAFMPFGAARLAASSRWLCVAGAALIAWYALRDADFTLLIGEAFLALAGWFALPRAVEAR